MKKIISLENYESEINILERAYYEVSARENIIKFMIQNNQNDLPQFKEFWNEYLHYLKAYEIIKNDFKNNCIDTELGYSFTGFWQVDFAKKEVTING